MLPWNWNIILSSIWVWICWSSRIQNYSNENYRITVPIVFFIRLHFSVIWIDPDFPGKIWRIWIHGSNYYESTMYIFHTIYRKYGKKSMCAGSNFHLVSFSEEKSLFSKFIRFSGGAWTYKCTTAHPQALFREKNYMCTKQGEFWTFFSHFWSHKKKIDVVLQFFMFTS